MNAFGDDQIRDAIIERASAWYVRHREGCLTTAEKEAFLQWLCASPQHTEEYLAAARLSGELPAAMADLNWNARALEEVITDGREEENVVRLQRIQRPSINLPAGIPRKAVLPLLAASLIGAFALYWFSSPGLLGMPRWISVGHAEQRTVRLRDGSLIHVNASSRVRVLYSSTARWVELDRGEALFEVARDRNRPFRVRAGTAEVTAVGTQFDVSLRRPKQVVVTVVQGKVDVVDKTWRAPDTGVSPMRLAAGEQVQLGVHDIPPQPRAVDVRAATAWIRREMLLEGEPLGDVAEEFNRYVPVPLRIDDPALRELKVSGVFNTYDLDSLIEFLRQYDVEVLERPDAIEIRRRASRE
jgi:transmembrane sensor